MPTNTNPFCPHRGGKTKMTTGTGKNTVLAAGELFVEYPDTGAGTGKSKIKIGDGVTAYSSLPYALGETSTDLITFSESTATSVTQALNEAVSGASLATIIAGLKKAIQLGGGGGGGVSIFTGTLAEWEALTDEEKAQYDLISNDEPGGLQDMFPSSLVGYGANSNVEAELNKLNDDMGEIKGDYKALDAIDIANYSSVANCYTCPSNGFVRMASTSGGECLLVSVLDDKSNFYTLINNTTAGIHSIFVKKGVKLASWKGTQGTKLPTVSFIPIISRS